MSRTLARRLSYDPSVRPAALATLARMLIAVNFHYIRDTFPTRGGIHGVSPTGFAMQLEELARIGDFVGQAEVKEAVQGDRAWFETPAVVVTFDDGLREQYDYAWPILQSRGIPAIFFVNTAPIAEATLSAVHKIHILRSEIDPAEFLDLLREQTAEHSIEFDPDASGPPPETLYRYDDPPAAALKYSLNFVLSPDDRERLVSACFSAVFPSEAEMSRALYMDVEQLRALNESGCLGSHGHEHLPLGLLDASRVEDQIDRSVEHLSTWTGTRPAAFSYPYGTYEACGPALADPLRSSTIEFAFTMERAVNTSREMPHHLARFDSNDVPGGKHPLFDADRFVESAPIARWYREVT